MNSPTNPSTTQDSSKQAVQGAQQKTQEGQKSDEQGVKQETQGGSAAEEISKR